MSNILVTWELGENWGHLSRDLPVARRLRAAGHRVAFAVADTRIAADILDPEGFAFVQAPFVRRPTAPSKMLAGHAEIVLARGYDDPYVLRGLVGGWLGTFDLFRPDVLLADYAPTAVLAARIRAMPAVLAGNGFELPPRVFPLPSCRPWDAVPPGRLAASEATALRHANQVLATAGSAPLDQLADLFTGRRRILTTFAELDHFGERTDEEYAGSVFELPRAQRVAWQSEGVGKRIFAYLRPSTPRVEDLLIALRANGADTICAFPGAPTALVQQYRSARLRIVATAVEIEPLLSAADLVIGHGSGTVAAALLAGVPLLLLPRWAEQRLGAMRVEALGAGLVALGQAAPPSYPALIERLLSEPTYRQAALRFAEKYVGFRSEHAVARVAEAVQRIDSQAAAHVVSP